MTDLTRAAPATPRSGQPGLDHPHRRLNALTGEWVLVSPHRTERPWQGAVEGVATEARPAFDPDCYLCPGNTRAGGAQNDAYARTFVFDNDFAALRPDVEPSRWAEGVLLAEAERGRCRVICYSPRHDLDMASMDVDGIEAVIDTWIDETAALLADHRWVQVFENRGATMGASNPHPHGQIWAGDALPVTPAAEDRTQRRHLEEHGRLLLADYADQEDGGPRVVAGIDGWLAVVPFWAVWPFETLVLPTEPARWIGDLGAEARRGLAAVLKTLLGAYDRVFDTPFPYSMGLHGAPAPVSQHDHWQFHIHFFPPLLRSATVRKHMVGYELMAEAQRDITPEQAAARLREVAGPADGDGRPT